MIHDRGTNRAIFLNGLRFTLNSTEFEIQRKQNGAAATVQLHGHTEECTGNIHLLSLASFHICICVVKQSIEHHEHEGHNVMLIIYIILQESMKHLYCS